MKKQISKNGRWIKVLISSNDVENFASKWPCSHFRYGDRVMVEFDRLNGDLVDLVCKGTYNDVFENYDEGAMSALVEDARIYAGLKTI